MSIKWRRRHCDIFAAVLYIKGRIEFRVQIALDVTNEADWQFWVSGANPHTSSSSTYISAYTIVHPTDWLTDGPFCCKVNKGVDKGVDVPDPSLLQVLFS